MAEYKTVRKNAQDQFVEKRSRFIGYACPVQTEQEALDFITSKKIRALGCQSQRLCVYPARRHHALFG